LLEIDGVIAVNGGEAVSQGGGGSGGSIWIVCDILKGYGKITANGGDSPSDSKYGYHGGGGAGGRIAVYFQKNETFSQFRYVGLYYYITAVTSNDVRCASGQNHLNVFFLIFLFPFK